VREGIQAGGVGEGENVFSYCLMVSLLNTLRRFPYYHINLCSGPLCKDPRGLISRGHFLFPSFSLQASPSQ